MISCKICSQQFADEKSLHMHLRSHKITLAEYYTQYYPRNNLLTGEPLPFKNKEQYFDRDFANRKQLLDWCAKTPDAQVKEYILELLDRRIKRKDLKFGPSHLELKTSDMPTVDFRRLRQHIYEPGGSRDANELIESFLGRKRSIQPFLKSIGIEAK